MAFYCFYFIFYQKMQPWWSYEHKKYYQKRRHDGGWRLRWKITGERPEGTRWSCLHIKGCPDMFWHSPGSPQPHLRILKWRGRTSWHRSPGCQTCFGFLLPWALNIKHTVFPPRPSVHDPQRYTVFQEITQLPHFFFLSIPFLITRHVLYSTLDYSSIAWHSQKWPVSPGLTASGKELSGKAELSNMVFSLRIWIIVQKRTILLSRYLKSLVNLWIW